MNKSRYLTLALAATAGFAYVAPANAAADLVSSCAVVGLDDITPGAQACAGYFDKNVLKSDAGSSASADEVAALNSIGLTGTITVLEKLDGSTNFNTSLNGLTWIGIHYGGAGSVPFSNNGGLTAFYRFDAGTNLDAFTTQFSNLSGVSLYKTGVPGVPEPVTWAMMLVGFAMIGGALRQRKVTVSYA